MRGVLKVFLENVIRNAVTYTEHGRRKTVTAIDVVFALKREGRSLYGFGGGGGVGVGGGFVSAKEKRRRAEAKAKRLARQTMPAFDHHGVTLRAVPADRVFAYQPLANGYGLAAGADTALHAAIVSAQGTLCDVGTGVSVSQSLAPNAEGNGLVHQPGCTLLVADEGGSLKGVAIVCDYDVDEGLIEPEAFGAAVDASMRAQGVPKTLMLELICARGVPTADGRNANYQAAKGLVEAVRRFALAGAYQLVVAKAENARSRDFLGRRGFEQLHRRGNAAAMQAAPAAIRV